MKKRVINIKQMMASFAQKSIWQRIIKNTISCDLFWLLLVCGLIRLIFFSCFLNTDRYSDSTSYLHYGSNIFLGQVNLLRTPVYPYFIKIIRLFGNDFLIQNVILIQGIISFLTIILFYKTVNLVFQNRSVILIASLIYGIMPSIINFDRCILTESLSVSAVVLFLYLMVNYLKRPTVLKAILFTLYIFFTIMLRPSFIILLPLVIAFWMMRLIFSKTDRKFSLSGIGATIVIVILIMGYSRLNYKYNGCNSISVVSQINQLDIIINADMYLDGNDPEISESIKNILRESNSPNHNLWILYKEYSYSRINKYISSCIINQPNIYIKQVLGKMRMLISSSSSVIYADMKGGLFSESISLVSEFLSINFGFLLILLVFDFVQIMILWMKSKQVPWFKLTLVSFITLQFVTIIIGAQAEYQRLFVIALPFVIILLFSYIDILIYSVDKDKLRKYSTFAF